METEKKDMTSMETEEKDMTSMETEEKDMASMETESMSSYSSHYHATIFKPGSAIVIVFFTFCLLFLPLSSASFFNLFRGLETPRG